MRDRNKAVYFARKSYRMARAVYTEPLEKCTLDANALSILKFCVRVLLLSVLCSLTVTLRYVLGSHITETFTYIDYLNTYLSVDEAVN